MPMAPLSILGRDLYGVVSWNINDTCNYRCSYCTQRFMPQRTYRLEEIERYLRAFASLPGAWEVKLSGGEPFQQPGLPEIAAGLVAQGHVISVQTNFSAGEQKLRAFLDATRGALHIFAASLHLEYATPADFIARHALVAPYLTDGARFCVTCVATPDRLEFLRDEVAPAFAAANIVFKVQPEKVHGVVRPYTDAQRDILLALGGHNGLGALEPSFRGRLCHAGSRYLVIKSNGEVFRCYPASRVGGALARLGSFTEGFAPLDGPRTCPYTHCNCTVPIHRGMMEGVSPSLGPEVS
jgi:MoaA/NifB/PqqE/SkfB family radical SAM enzyme